MTGREMDCGSMHPNVEASIADLRAIAMAHPELSDELHDVIGQLRDTECRSIVPGGFLAWLERMADAERHKAVDRTASRQSDMAFGRMQAFEDAASRLRGLTCDTEQESEDQGGSGGA